MTQQTWRSVLRIHPAAELLPLMTDTELRELGEDIKRHGLRTPIAIFRDQDGNERLLDGRNRLDAMERIELPIIKKGELDPDIVQTESISGNINPIAWVLSANVHRRHLTNEQKHNVIEQSLKADPNQSNRIIAKQAKVDDKTVGTIRKKMESRAEIPHVKTRTDSKGRKQPAKKEQATPKSKVETKPAKERPDKNGQPDHLKALAESWNEVAKQIASGNKAALKAALLSHCRTLQKTCAALVG